MEIKALCGQIGYSFIRPDLLRQALTHRSYSSPHNERLEFLGDSVLNCAVACLVFETFPHLSEGELSRLRANLVNQQALFGLAQRLSLGDQVLLGEGELRSGGTQRPSILADALEAVFGAVFLDGGFAAAEQVIRGLYSPLIKEFDSKTPEKDPKTLLQEYLQGRRLPLPKYNVIAARGEAHKQQFQVECVVAELNIRALGEGSSRRNAEQEAAKHAYEQASRN